MAVNLLTACLLQFPTIQRSSYFQHTPVILSSQDQIIIAYEALLHHMSFKYDSNSSHKSYFPSTSLHHLSQTVKYFSDVPFKYFYERKTTFPGKAYYCNQSSSSLQVSTTFTPPSFQNYQRQRSMLHAHASFLFQQKRNILVWKCTWFVILHQYFFLYFIFLRQMWMYKPITLRKTLSISNKLSFGRTSNNES